MKLKTLRARGLMSRDFEIHLQDMLVITGPNGAGKTAFHQALRLLALGKPGKLGGRSEDTMRLARTGASELEIHATFTDGDRELWVRRSWTRDKKLRVSEKISGTLIEGASGTAAAKGMLSASIAGWTETWTPDDLLAEDGPKLRRKLIGLLGRSANFDIKTLVPKNAPAWARPQWDDMSVEEWTTFALKKAREEKDAAAAELADLEGALRNTSFAVDKPSDKIRARLESLRSELTAHTAQAFARSKVTALQRTVQRFRTALAEAEAAAAKAGVGDQDKAELELEVDDLAGKVGAVLPLIAERDRAISRAARAEAALVPPAIFNGASILETFSPAELESVTILANNTKVEAAALRTAAKEAAAAVKAIADAGLEACPSCGFSLTAHVTESRARAEALAGQADKEAATARLAADSAAAALAKVTRGNAVLAVLGDAWKAEEELARLRAEIPPPVPSAPSSELAEARWRLACWVARDTRRAELDAAELELAAEEGAASELPELRPEELIRVDISAAETELVELGEERERAGNREDIEAEIVEAKRMVEIRKGWVDHFVHVQTKAVQMLKAAVEGPASRVVGQRVTIQLEDARGNPDCRIYVDDTPLETQSDGEAIVVFAGILVALAPPSARWRPILIDRFESISANNRAHFLGALGGAIVSGAIDQCIITGCPDTKPVLPVGIKGELIELE